MVRSLLLRFLMLGACLFLAQPLAAYNSQGYVKIYNYTGCELKVYLNGSHLGTIPAQSAPTWVPADYGYHKVELYKPNWKGTSKYCELSYSYPNADVEVAAYDL